MKSNNLCAVVAVSTMKGVVQQIQQCKNLTQYIEVRFDYSNNRSDIDLALLKKSTEQKIIITCRRSDEGGKWKGNEIERISILKRAFDLGFLVDVELQTLEEGRLELSSSLNKQVIISFHDFTKTPSYKELGQVIARMDKYSPHIKKIATLVKSRKDEQKLFRLLTNKRDSEKLTIIGMGEKGIITRIISPLLGGEMTYCTIVPKGQTAPGQLSCSEMLKFINY